MRIFLTGGTGFVGTHLIRALLERGDECVVISRSAKNPWSGSNVRIVRANPVQPGKWQDQVSGVDLVVNLAGQRIVDPPRRWTDQTKQALRESRVATTKNVADAIRKANEPPSLFLSASAIGFYGSRGDEELTEASKAGTGFLAELSVEWERAALAAKQHTRVAVLRTALVLGNEGGPLPPMLPPFKLGVGGPWGDGKQWWSWIHIADHVRLMLFIVERQLADATNLTAPNPVTVNEFAATLGRVLNRPVFFRVPALAMRAALGEAASALLDSQRVLPLRALEMGFEFRFPTVTEALQDLL